MIDDQWSKINILKNLMNNQVPNSKDQKIFNNQIKKFWFLFRDLKLFGFWCLVIGNLLIVFADDNFGGANDVFAEFVAFLSHF